MKESFNKRILIVDDHPIMRRGLAETLESEPGFEVIGQLESSEEALKFYGTTDIDLMIVDVSLPGMNGIELVKNIIFQNPEQKILILSRHEESLYAERSLRAGAMGYIMKFEPADELMKAIRKILKNGIYLSEEISEKLLATAVHGKKVITGSPLELLSDRELEVYELIGKGQSSNQIASRLHLAPKTIETYRSRIKEKLNYRNSTEMMYHAVKWVETEH